MTRFGRLYRPERDQLIAVACHQIVAVRRDKIRRDAGRINNIVQFLDHQDNFARRIRGKDTLYPVKPFQKIRRPLSRIIQIPVIERVFLILSPL